MLTEVDKQVVRMGAYIAALEQMTRQMNEALEEAQKDLKMAKADAASEAGFKDAMIEKLQAQLANMVKPAE